MSQVPAKKLTVKWVKSAIGYNEAQKRTLKALGLKKLGQVREYNDSPQVRGLITQLHYLVRVEE